MSWSPVRTTEAGLPLCPWHVSACCPAPRSAGCTGGKKLNDYLTLEVSFFSAIMSLGQETSLQFVNGILVSYCCWIRLPQVRRLKQCKCIVSHSEGQKSHRGLMGRNSGCQQVLAFPAPAFLGLWLHGFSLCFHCPVSDSDPPASLL